jgi:hypothetical protein
MTDKMRESPKPVQDPDGEERRQFLLRYGRFAAVTPPAITMLLAASSVPREAHASTIGHGRGHENDGP